MKAYASVKSVDANDLARAGRELKTNWKHVSSEISRVAKKDGAKAKSAVKKAVSVAKKAAKTTTPKKKSAKKAKK